MAEAPTAQLRSRTWNRRFASPPEAIWPLLADTARYNEAAGLPKHEIEERPRADGSVEYLGRARMGPFRLEWRDGPANWVLPPRPVPPSVVIESPKSNAITWPGWASTKSALDEITVSVSSAPLASNVSVPLAISLGVPGVPPAISAPSTSACHSHAPPPFERR